MSHWRQSMASIRRILPGPMLVAVWLLSTACSPLQRQVVQAGDAGPPPATEDVSKGGKTAIERAIFLQRWSDVATLAQRHRGDDPPWMLGWQVFALWRSGQTQQARLAEDQLLGSPAHAPARDEAIRRLARMHLKLRKQPDDAWRVTAPLRQGGCHHEDTCNLSLAILAAMPTGTEEALVRALSAAPPRGADGTLRTRWLAALALRWGAGNQWQAARDLLLRDARDRPQDSSIWLAAYTVARRQPGPEGRAAWLSAALQAPMSPAQRTAVACHADLAHDRAAARDLLTTATQAADAPELAWMALAAVLMRGEDPASVAALPATQLPSTAGRLMRARAALATRQPQLAQAALDGLDEHDAVVLALQAELARQQGDVAKARGLASRVAQATGDRSLGELLVGLTSKSADGEAALERAAGLEGRGQRTAARLRAARLMTPSPTPASIQAVMRYAKALATRDDGGCGPLGDEPEPDLASARQQLLRQIASPLWSETIASVLRLWADHGVADAEQLRQLALRSLAQGDLQQFEVRERSARLAAAREGVTLAQEPLLAELLRRGGPSLARWLVTCAAETIDDGALVWRTAMTLARQDFGILAMRWLAAGSTWAGDMDWTAAQLLELATSGGAEGALAILTRLRAAGKAQDVAWLHVEVSAWLALREVEEATRRLITAAQRADLQGRSLRPLLDVAGEHGLCHAVAALAPRVAMDGDLYHVRAALSRGLECARRMQDGALARAMIQATQGNRPDMTRLEALGQQLSASGWDALAVQVLASIEWARPPSDDTIVTWARSLLVLGQTDAALDVLGKATASRGRVARTWLRGAELLEDHGMLSQAVPFYRGAVTADPDSSRLRVRLLTALLRLGQHDEAAPVLLALAKLGATAEDLGIVLQVARRTRGQAALLTALKGVTDPDRDIERLRAEFAADLGDRDTVVMTVRRMRDKGGLASADMIRWLEQVGALGEARQAAEDALASAEPVGQGEDRRDLLQAALDLRLDGTSEQEAIGLVRLYTARALDPEQAATDAALTLSRLGYRRAAWATAQAWKIDKDLRYTTLRARYAWDAGDHAEAKRLWAQVRAASLLDPAAREVLRTTRLATAREARGDDLYVAVGWTWSEMLELGLFDDTTRWLEALLQAAPESEVVHTRLVQTWLQMGRPDAAAAALRRARQQLRTWPVELQAVTDHIAREGGRELIRPSSEAIALGHERTDAWWLAAIAPDNPQDPLHRVATALAAAHPPLRQQWALRAAGRGRGDEAVQWLGADPAATRDDRLEPALRAMAAALIALRNQAGLGAAEAQLQRWLSSQRGIDVAIGLAWELVRQGQPQLAQKAMTGPTWTNASVAADLSVRRLLAACGAAEDGPVVDTALAYLRGQRSHLVSLPGQPVRGPSDDVLDWLLSAGRWTAARQLTAALRGGEPNLATPPGLEDLSRAPIGVRVHAADPQVVPLLVAAAPALPRDEARDALTLAAALAPQTADALADALARAQEEGWRWHLMLARLHLDLERPDDAKAALQRASGAAAGATACLRGALLAEPAWRACIGDRSMGALDGGELGDAAVMLARGLQDTDGQHAARWFAEADNPARHRLIAAATARLQGTPARTAFAAWLSAQLQQLPDPLRQALAVLAMDELAPFGLGNLGTAACTSAVRNDPDGAGVHNNLAYALHLAGRPAAESLPHAMRVEHASHGEAAYAALDTLAAIVARQGRAGEALAIQQRALAAAQAPSLDQQPAMALLWQRYAALLLANGQADAARTAVAEAMRRVALGQRTDDHPMASLWLLRLLRDTATAQTTASPTTRSAAPAVPSSPPAAAAPHGPP